MAGDAQVCCRQECPSHLFWCQMMDGRLHLFPQTKHACSNRVFLLPHPENLLPVHSLNFHYSYATQLQIFQCDHGTCPFRLGWGDHQAPWESGPQFLYMADDAYCKMIGLKFFESRYYSIQQFGIQCSKAFVQEEELKRIFPS